MLSNGAACAGTGVEVSQMRFAILPVVWVGLTTMLGGCASETGEPNVTADEIGASKKQVPGRLCPVGSAYSFDLEKWTPEEACLPVGARGWGPTGRWPFCDAYVELEITKVVDSQCSTISRWMEPTCECHYKSVVRNAGSAIPKGAKVLFE
jgi:hypothetical protein